MLRQGQKWFRRRPAAGTAAVVALLLAAWALGWAVNRLLLPAPRPAASPDTSKPLPQTEQTLPWQPQPVEPAPQGTPGDSGSPAQAPGTSGEAGPPQTPVVVGGPGQPTTPLGTAAGFRYAACTASEIMYPKSAAASGYTPVERPAAPALEGILAVSVGHVTDMAGYGYQFGASYALAEDGTIYRWGLLAWAFSERAPAFPQQVPDLPGQVKQVDGRFVLTEKGSVYDLNAPSGPSPIPELAGATAIAQAFDTSVYALGQDGRLRLYELHGPDGHPKAAAVAGIDNIAAVHAGPHATIVTKKDGTVWRLPSVFGMPGDKPAAVQLPDGEHPKRIAVTLAYETPVFIQTERGAWYSLDMQGAVKPAAVPPDTVQMAGTAETYVALKSDGTVWTWGKDLFAGLTRQETIPAEQPRQIGALRNVTAIAVGSDHMLALTRDGSVQSLGSNMYGQLGRLPIFAADPYALGVWEGLDRLFPVYDRLYALRDGDVWSLDARGHTRPVFLGHRAAKAIPAFGHAALLTGDGSLYAVAPEEDKPCQRLEAPSRIVDADGIDYGVLVALENGRSYYLQASFGQIDQAKELTFDVKPKGRVTRVFGQPVPFVLTDQGELYYEETSHAPRFKLVHTAAPLKEWSPMHYLFLDSEQLIGKALDREGGVYEIRLSMNWETRSVASVKAVRTKETGIRVSGGAVVEANGRIREKLDHMAFDTRLPTQSMLRETAAVYHVPIEGRSYLYHYFLMEDGTLYWLGDWPSGADLQETGYVIRPQ